MFESKRVVVSTYPTYEAGFSIGGLRSVPVTMAIRCAAKHLGDACLEVAGMFTPKEWEAIATAFQEKTIEPEDDSPQLALAQLLTKAHDRYRIGEAITEKIDVNPDAAIASIARRIHNLDYWQAWSVIYSCMFRWHHQEVASHPWWRLDYRRKFFEKAYQEKQSKAKKKG